MITDFSEHGAAEYKKNVIKSQAYTVRSETTNKITYTYNIIYNC